MYNAILLVLRECCYYYALLHTFYNMLGAKNKNIGGVIIIILSYIIVRMAGSDWVVVIFVDRAIFFTHIISCVYVVIIIFCQYKEERIHALHVAW